MRKLNMKPVLGVAIAISACAIMAPREAHALFGGGSSCAPSHLVSREHNDTRSFIEDQHELTRDAVIDAIEVMRDTLVETLTLQARENSNHLDRQVSAQERIEDGAQQNATDRMRQQFRAEAEAGMFDPNPFMCMMLDMFGSGGAGGQSAAAQGAEVVDDIMRRLSGDSDVVRTGGIALAQDVIDAREEYRNFGGSDSATTDWSLMLTDPTVDMDDEDTRNVMNLIIANALEVAPPRPISDADMQTPEGIAEAALRQGQLARYNAAAEVMSMTLNMRTPVLNDPGIYEEMARDSAYNRDLPENGRLSELQQLDIRTVYHYAPGPSRQADLQEMASNEAAWLQEIHRLLSLNTRMDYIRLELENRNAIVNALILAAITNQNQ